MIRELAKRLGSPSRTHFTMLSKGISRTHSFLRPHLSHTFNIYGLRCYALKAVSSVPAPEELALETAASLTTISASKKKKATPKKKLDSVNILSSVSCAPAPDKLALETAASLNTISATKKKAATKKKKLTSVNTLDSVPSAQLPVYSYKDSQPLPTVVYTQHEEEANELIAGLKVGPIAFDMEWRLLIRRVKGAPKASLVDRRTSVVQVADSNGLILVIQIYNMSRIPIKLQSLLENPEIPKIGVNILNDGKKLFRDYGIAAQNLVELGALAWLADPAGTKERSTTKRKIISLVKLVQWYCGMEVDKGKERVGNWELNLDELQIDYAANDVHASMAVYQKLCSIAQQNTVSLTDNKSAFTSHVTELPSSSEIVEPSSPEIVGSPSSEMVESPSLEMVKSPSSEMIRDQPIQSSPSVYGRFIRRVLGLKALVKAFFVKP